MTGMENETRAQSQNLPLQMLGTAQLYSTTLKLLRAHYKPESNHFGVGGGGGRLGAYELLNCSPLLSFCCL